MPKINLSNPVPWFFAALSVIFILGMFLLPKSIGSWHLGMSTDVRSNLAVGLIGGAIIGGAVLGGEVAFGRQLAKAEHKRAADSERDALRIQLSMGQKFPGIDLGGKDLSGFYLADRTFSEANLSGANLTGACLDRANLSGANLTGAIDLGSATLDHVKWHPEHPPTWPEGFVPPPNAWPGDA
jgi:hypothetical protein